MKTDIGYLSILRCFLDMTSTIGLCINFHIEHNRVIRTAHHCLETDTPPDQHIIADTRNIFLYGKRYRAGNHAAAGKGILISTTAHTDTASTGKLQIRHGIVGIVKRKGILFGSRIILQRMNLRGAASA